LSLVGIGGSRQAEKQRKGLANTLDLAHKKTRLQERSRVYAN